MAFLYIVRHGESAWNLENRFTGWVDVPITETGREEMVTVGRKLRGLPIAVVYTSALRRTRESADVILRTAAIDVPIVSAWELNERFYGRLQGLDKDQSAGAFGAEQVRLWRRSYAARPPGGESLEDTGARVLPYLSTVILPRVGAGTDVLVCGHGNTLRVMSMRLDQLDAQSVEDLEIPTGALHRYNVDLRGQVSGKATL